MGPIISILILAIQVLIWLVIIDAILSWVPDLRHRWRGFTRTLESVTDPILAPFRRLVPPSKTGGLDLSPILAIIALQILMGVLSGLARGPRIVP